MTRRSAIALIAALALVATACNTVGPRAVRTSRIDYNQAMTAGYNEQLLLNLVRLRYRDTPQFLEVSQFTTSHVLGGSATASALLGAGDDDVGLSATGTYEENPTVVYSPLTGDDVVTKLLTPVEVPTLYLLMRSGWSIERVLRLCVRQMKTGGGAMLLNAPSADGPTPSYRPQYEEFARVARGLRELQTARYLRPDARRRDDGTGKDGSAEDGVGKSDAGKSDAGKSGDAAPAYDPYLVLLPEEHAEALPALEPEVERSLCAMAPEGAPAGTGPGCLQRLLGTAGPAAVGRTEIALVAGRIDPAAEEAGPRLEIYPRSLMGVLYFLSQAVAVPEAHRDMVTLTEAAAGEPTAGAEWPSGGLDWSRTVLGDLFAVRTSPRRPDPDTTFVAVRYRGHWFHIPDTDLTSKSTFALLTQLFSLQSGDPKDRAAGVLLTLGG